MLAAFGPLAIDMYLPAFPAIAADLRASSSAVGLTLAVYFVGLSIGQLVIGPISDRIGRVRPVRVGLGLFAVASLAAAAAPNVELLIVARACEALGGAACAVASRAVIRDLYRGHAAAQALSRLVLVMGVAPILAPTLGGLILEVAGWRVIFVLLAAAGAGGLAVVWLTLPETAPLASEEPRLDALRALVRDRCFVAYVLAGALVQAGMFAYITGSPFVFITLHGVSQVHFGWLFGFNAAGYIAMSQLNVRLLNHRRPARLLVVGLTVALLAALTLLVLAITGAEGAVTVEVTLFAYVASLGLVLPNATALALEDQGARAGSASAWQGATQFAIGALAAAAVSALNDGTAVPMAAVMAVVATASAAILVLAHRLRPRR